MFYDKNFCVNLQWKLILNIIKKVDLEYKYMYIYASLIYIVSKKET